MKKFLCMWSDRPNQWQDVKVVEGFSFFNDANGYDDSHRHMVNRLQTGDTVDLSDGISQYHEVRRLI